ncbi:MAG: hypothetical protein HYR97_06170 [Candidatus Melainabacteria bacterium]|nr:hypothetical protein [Candidatus Melainabacteria bacterium]
MRIEQTAIDPNAGLGTLEPRTASHCKIIPSPSPTENLYHTDTIAQNIKPRSSLARKALSFSKWTGITLGYLTLGIIALLKTPGMHRLGNHVLQETGDIPMPANVSTNTGLDKPYSFDSFFETHAEFDPIKYTASQFIDPTSLDLNKNHIILDTSDETNALKTGLEKQREAYQHTSKINEINTVIKKFDELNFVNQLIWGKSQNPRHIFQGGRPNCQLMGSVQAHFLIPEKIQEIKDTIRVTNCDISPDNFYIDTVVNLNGKDIVVPYDDLVKWMSPRGLMPSRSYDGALAIPILTYALEKELTDNYDGVPPTFPASSPILLTGDDYSAVSIHPSFFLNTMSDQALIDVLQEAPQKPVLVCTQADTKKIVEETVNWFKEKLGLEVKERGFALLPTSEENETSFKESTQARAQNIFNETAVGFASIEDKTTSQTETITPPNIPKSSYFPDNHLYVVKKYNAENNTVELIDSHGVEYEPLSLDKFREKMAAVVIHSNDVPTFTTESLKGYLPFLLVLSGHVFLYRRKKKNILKSTEIA